MQGAGPVCLGLMASRKLAWGANERIRLAVIGLGNKGSQHVDVFRGLEGVRFDRLEAALDIRFFGVRRYRCFFTHNSGYVLA